MWSEDRWLRIGRTTRSITEIVTREGEEGEGDDPTKRYHTKERRYTTMKTLSHHNDP